MITKKLLLGIIFFLGLILPQASQAQCPYNNVQFGTSTAPTTPNVLTTLVSNIHGGEFHRVSGMIGGSTYRISTCGGAVFDTQLSIYAIDGGSLLASNDDYCGLQSQLKFVPPSTGTYDVLVDRYFCTSTTLGATIVATLLSSGPLPPTTCLQTFNMPYSEDFESFQLCLSGCTSICQVQIPSSSGWKNATNDTNDWIVDRMGTGSRTTGPSGPIWTNTSGTDFNPGTTSGKYLYTESSGCSNTTSDLISPCILVSGTCPQLTFAYTMYGVSMGTMNVAISTDAGNTWGTSVFSRSGNQGAAWHIASVDLTVHIGQTVSFRIASTRGSTFTSDIAIDDFNVIDASDGSSTFTGLPLFISTQDPAVTLKATSAGGTFTSSPPTAALNGNVFNPANATPATIYSITYTVGPSSPACQQRTKQSISVAGMLCQTPVLSTFPYKEDFESWNNCSTSCGSACPVPASAIGWLQGNGDDFDWTVDAGGTSSFQTGPSLDFNPGTSSGKYLYTESSGTPCKTGEANLLSPCFDLSTVKCPVVSIAYIMYGTQMVNATFNLDISTDGGNTWTNIFNASENKGDLWQKAEVNISAYSGIVRFRMQGQTGGFSTDIAIDDFQLKDLATSSSCFYKSSDCCALNCGFS